MNTKAKQQGKQRRKAIAQLYKSGKTMEQIAGQLGITPQRVWQILNSKKWDAYLNNDSNYQKKLERARKRYAAKRAAGMTREQILSPTQIKKAAKVIVSAASDASSLPAKKVSTHVE